MRLEANAGKYSPGSALSLRCRVQQHRATIGERACSGVSKTTTEQLDLFDALKRRKP